MALIVTTVPHSARPGPPLFCPVQADDFFKRILQTARSHSVPLTVGDSVSAPWDAASYAELVQLTFRARVALGLWAAPVLPTRGLLRGLRLPAGAHPVRLKGYLLELDAADAHTDLEAADGWLMDFRSAVDQIWRGTSPEAEELSLVSILRHTVSPSDHWGIRPDGPLPYPQMVRGLAKSLLVVYEAAARVHADGPMSADTEPAPDEALRAARGIVLDVFERHARWDLFIPPAVMKADLLMLAESPNPRTRTLAIHLAPDAVAETRLLHR